MKAWVLREKGDIALLDTDKPKLQEGEVLIRVMALLQISKTEHRSGLSMLI